ncbi:hypothetical protein O7599_08430 [Streptomyces sp. WMMC500]|uniref:hypothetical protein n=1 Tax=Streptomyces sp. WMMC500 TaxID=3015154 RepID=UPI00248D361C|nr:hypothetical protein [Streptomyces sp. WMMC500]WBB62545.1 hypothetical protein O7599_08430 [Streptomyces sp. WMMC500]
MTRTRTGMRMRAVPAAALLAALTVSATGLLAGCGSGGGDGAQVASVDDQRSGGDEDGSGGDDVAQAQEFVDCMRANGIEMEDPDPKTGKLNLQEIVGGGADREELNEGLDACRDVAPQSLQDAGEAGQNPEALQKFTACMRDNGVAMEDPGPEGLDPQAMPTEDADYQRALDTCRDQLTEGSGGGR